MNKINFEKISFLVVTDIICFIITRLFIDLSNNIYLSAVNILQILYLIPILLTTIYFFVSKSDKKSLVISTIALTIYSAIFYIFVKQIFSQFINTSGIVNTLEYSYKIYFIFLPLFGFTLFKLKKENIKKSCFLLIFKIICLLVITLLFNNLFSLKGVLYAWPLTQTIFTAILFFI